MYEIKSSLPADATKTMVHGFIYSCLDNCNSQLYGLSNMPTKKKIKTVENTAARLITVTYKYHNVMHVLEWLHWLPVEL